MQTNRPYTYLVPERLTNQVEAGMRVIVPFGRGHREVQGFVVATGQTESAYQGALKELTALMDLTPVLNPEMLALSKWLADHTYAFWISCLYTMLPNLLKAKTKRLVRVIDEFDPQLQQSLFGEAATLDLAQVQTDPAAMHELVKLKRAGKVQIEYAVEDQARAKQVTALQATLDFEAYEELLATVPKNAKAQQRLLVYLQGLGEQKVPLKAARQQTGLSLATFRLGEQRGWLKKSLVEQLRTPMRQTKGADRPVTLNAEQTAAVTAIQAGIQATTAPTFLLKGVTGSGKTEVYLRAMAAALANGQTALMLVPEIALTPQMVQRVRGRFGQQVAILHSGLSNGERYDEWRRIQRQEVQVVVGTRSAIFAPLPKLGLIVIDEEHENSYKQEDAPRYHAREVAKWRAQYHHAAVVLGSATPSLESYARAKTGNYHLLTLTHRVNQQPLPPVTVVDMRQEPRQGGESNFSRALLAAVQARLAKGEQSILLLNRRGFSSFMMCRDCGYVLKCPNCDISLTLHLATQNMKCHYCGFEAPIPQRCPHCASRQIRYYGTGTEKVEAELKHRLPAARVIRMDVDTTRRKGQHAKLLQAFGQHQADILLGTQMIAKGLDFPNVTLVGVLNADTGLDLPDFRAGERTFDLLAQVSGRAGRADKAGQVFIQTYNPDNYVIQLAQAGNYEAFFGAEMQLRKQAQYPPYFYTVRLMVAHPEEKAAAKVIHQLARRLQGHLAPETVVLGPTPRAIARIKNQYYYQIVIKYRHDPALHQLLTELQHEIQRDRQLHFAIDPDPQYFM